MMDRAEYALTMGLAVTLFFGGIGYLLKRLIWKSKDEVTNRLDQAKKFASNFVFAASLGSGHFFLKNEIPEAIVQMVIVVVTFGVIGFVLGFLYWIVVKEKNWKPLLWVVGAVVVFSVAGNDDDYGDKDMYFSIKYALLYVIAGFVASAYHQKEIETGRTIALGGLALCVVYTISTYGFNYGILTAIEYAVGYGLAQLVFKKENDVLVDRDLGRGLSNFNASNTVNLEQSQPATEVSKTPNVNPSVPNVQKSEPKSNAFWIFMAAVVMSATALLIKFNPEKKSSTETALPPVAASALPSAETPVVPAAALPPVSLPDLPSKKSEPPRLENSYLQIDKELIATLKGSRRVMVIQVALMTHYDATVFDNVKKNEFAIRRSLLALMENTTEYEILESDFRNRLAEKMKIAMNEILEKNEGFGGVEDVFFTSFVVTQ